MDKTVQIVFPKNDFLKLYKQAGTSTVVDLEGDYKGMVLIYDLQIDTITNNLLHVDFLAVRADEEVTADVSIVLSGESVLVKNNEGRIELLRDNISVTALPRDLPHEIVIDISNIVTLQDGIFMRDLDL
jgi:large subunit ribosomal protein L25